MEITFMETLSSEIEGGDSDRSSGGPTLSGRATLLGAAGVRPGRAAVAAVQEYQ